MKIIAATAFLTLATAPAAAAPQTSSPPPAATSRFGGIGSLLGGGIPNVASSSAGNAAGLLGYCVRNNVLGGGSAASVLGKLAGTAGVATSPGYAAGQAGTLQTGTSALSLDGLKGRVKTQVCNLVLQHAKSFL